MKILTFIFSLTFSFALQAQTTQLTLSEVAKKVGSNNFKVYENALKVYQAKKDIERVRLQLLPKLNIWTIARTVVDPTSLIDSVTDIAPFLVPANWFRLEQNKILYLAENEAYRALWGNEIHAAKAMYIRLLLDQTLLEFTETGIAELTETWKIIQIREALGGSTPGLAREIEIRILGLKDDQRNLANLVKEELDTLSLALGMPASTTLQLASVPVPDVQTLAPLNYAKYEFQLLANSPERRQFDHILSALKQVKNEITYSFLGGSNISRGVAGGIFDNLPTPDGLGFGQGPSIKIVEAQKEIIRTQKRGIEETLKRQLKALVNSFNTDLTAYKDVQHRLELIIEGKKQLLLRIRMGEDISLLELTEASRNQVQAQSAILGLQYRVLMNQDRLDRLLFVNDYSMAPKQIDKLNKKKGEK